MTKDASITFRAGADLKAMLETLAREKGRSLAGYIERKLREHAKLEGGFDPLGGARPDGRGIVIYNPRTDEASFDLRTEVAIELLATIKSLAQAAGKKTIAPGAADAVTLTRYGTDMTIANAQGMIWTLTAYEAETLSKIVRYALYGPTIPDEEARMMIAPMEGDA